MSSPIVLHLPHASTFIPEDLRDDFLLSDEELEEELNRITDHATDVIFQKAFSEAKAIVFPVSRLVVDPERFSDGSQEPMSQVRMGVTYTRGPLRQPLREQPTEGKRQELLERYYIPHHQKLTDAVEESLFANDHCLIIDGHSFPALPMPYELNQRALRPDFCLGTDDFHTSEELVERVEKELQSLGYSTARDQPFSGTIVPMKHYRKDQRVQSLMIEINRWLYLGGDYSVDSERAKTLVNVLRRVAEVLEDN
tara:strand:- start:265 stop:1023 length:759 start_codon:yes stop_codon:yes gene_type:complete